MFDSLWVLLFTEMIYERILDMDRHDRSFDILYDWVVDIGSNPFVCRNRFGDLLTCSCVDLGTPGVSRTNLDLAGNMGASESKPVVLPVRGPETPIKVYTTIYHIPPIMD